LDLKTICYAFQETLKRELDSYREYLDKLKASRRAEEKRFDERLEELKKAQEQKGDFEKMKLENARQELGQVGVQITQGVWKE